jgi:hypothetical protein
MYVETGPDGMLEMSNGWQQPWCFRLQALRNRFFVRQYVV